MAGPGDPSGGSAAPARSAVRGNRAALLPSCGIGLPGGCLAVFLFAAAILSAAEGAPPSAGTVSPSEKAGWVSEGRWPHGRDATLPSPVAQLAKAKDLERVGNVGAAAIEYEKLVRVFPESAESETGHLGAGRCRFLCGQFKEAGEQLAELRRRFAKSELLDPAAEIEISVARGYLEGKGSDGDLPLRSRVRRAIVICERILKDDSMSRWADDAKLALGLCRKAAGQYDAAIGQFKELLDQYPQSDLRAEAEAQIAECVRLAEPDPAYTETESREARLRLAVARDEAAVRGQELDETILDETERAILSREAQKKYEEALFYERNGKWRAAEVCLELVVKRYRGTEWAGKARDRLEILRKR